MEFQNSQNINQGVLLTLTTCADKSIKDYDHIQFTDWAIWTEADPEGYPRKNLAVMGAEGSAYYTQSKSFIASFEKIAAIMGDKFIDFDVDTRMNSNGDNYILCRAGSLTFAAAI